MFYQAQSSVHATTSGLGIGLTLVRRLVELHGGHIEARSEGLGKGSEFVVYLPLVKQKRNEKDLNRTDYRQEAAMRRRILVVDDNKTTTSLFTMLLKDLGCEVESANEGAKAVELAPTFQPEVVMLDLSMPGMDGYETCRRIRQQPGGEKIVLLAVTGLGGGETLNRARVAGFDDVLVKPVKAADLVRLTRGVADSRAGLSGSSPA